MNTNGLIITKRDMEKILKKIIEKNNVIESIIDQANKSSDTLTFIYGCGNSGIQLAKRFSEPRISGFVVADNNRENYCIDYKVMDIYPLYKLSELQKMKQKIRLLVSIAPSEELENGFSGIESVKEVYYLDGQQLLFDPLTYKLVEDNSELLDELYEKLEDKCSKELLIAYLNTRISGNLQYIKGFTGETRKGIYFDNNIWKSNTKEKVYLDCGAYTGDSIEDFIRFTENNYTKIIAFEPNRENIEKLKELKSKFRNIEIISKGVWNKKERLVFNSKRGPMSEITSEGTDYIDVDKIDNYVNDYDVTMIKMNIEGSEYNALLGAEKTIKAKCPKLAISVYHRPEDLFTIPQLILGFVPQYTLKLRLYSHGSGLLILFAEHK